MWKLLRLLTILLFVAALPWFAVQSSAGWSNAWSRWSNQMTSSRQRVVDIIDSIFAGQRAARVDRDAGLRPDAESWANGFDGNRRSAGIVRPAGTSRDGGPLPTSEAPPDPMGNPPKVADSASVETLRHQVALLGGRGISVQRTDSGTTHRYLATADVALPDSPSFCKSFEAESLTAADALAALLDDIRRWKLDVARMEQSRQQR